MSAQNLTGVIIWKGHSHIYFSLIQVYVCLFDWPNKAVIKPTYVKMNDSDGNS